MKHMLLTAMGCLVGLSGEAQVLFSNINAPLPGVYNSSVTWGDYNNDGYLDILLTGYDGSGTVAGYHSQVWRNQGNGTFANSGQPLYGVNYGSTAWGDYDNDGNLDFLLSGYTDYTSYTYVTEVWHNQGNGSFAQVFPGFRGVENGAVAWGDFDNDGKLDALITGYDGTNIITQLWRNLGNGRFTNMQVALPGVYQSSVALGDFDNDGNLDILLTGYTGPGSTTVIAQVWRNLGNWTFTNINAGLIGVGAGQAAWADLDNDGYLDIVIASADSVASPTVQVWRNLGNGTFSQTNALPLPPAVRADRLVVGDFDNDGYTDIMWSGVNTNALFVVQLWHNQGNWSFTNVNAGLTGVDYGALACGDFDNDGRLDILLTGDSLVGTTVVPVAQVWRNLTPLTNTPPTAPSGLAAAVTSSNAVTLTWQAASDAQTPAPGLSYNIRVGTTPGGWDIVSPEADATTGFRRVAQLGNAQERLFAIVTNLPLNQTFYWSVQAVDTSFAGGPFASESTFTTICTDPTCTVTSTNVCPGTSVCLTVNATAFNGASIANYSWTGGPSGPTATSKCFTPANVSDSGTYTVTVTDTHGCQSSAVATLTVSPNPVCTVPDVRVCIGGSACLTADVATCGGATIVNYSWQGGPSGPSASTKCFGNAGTADSGTYSVTVMDSQGLQSTASGTLTVGPLEVLDTDDSGPGSLRQAIQDAATQNCASDVITFAPGLSGFIILTNSGLVIGQNLVIAGPGAGVMTVECLDGKSSVFNVTNGTVSITGLTIADAAGGGISNSATLSVSDCLITGNLGSGVINSLYGVLKLNKCAIVGNNASPNGASRYVAGGVYNDSSSILMMTNCTVFGNSVSNLTAYGGGIWNEGTAVLISCTVSSNSCTAASSGLAAEGGGIFNPGTMSLGNTILAGNSTFLVKPFGLSSPDGRGTFVSYGYNLIGKTNGSSGWGSIGDRLGSASSPLNPMLGPLADNGGPTPTCALLPGSLALDAGYSFGVTNDQRGLPRPVDLPYIPNAPGGDGSDIGAFEFNPPVLTALLTTTNTVMVYWPSPSTGYNLQVNTDPATPTWSAPGETVTDNGTIQFIIVNPATGKHFYRLIGP